LSRTARSRALGTDAFAGHARLCCAFLTIAAIVRTPIAVFVDTAAVADLSGGPHISDALLPFARDAHVTAWRADALASNTALDGAVRAVATVVYHAVAVFV
jgi:hypothetical protein